MIKKTVAPERGSHCTLRADLCVFPRTWVHGVQFLLVRVDLRTRLTAHQQIKNKKWKLSLVILKVRAILTLRLPIKSKLKTSNSILLTKRDNLLRNRYVCMDIKLILDYSRLNSTFDRT